MAKKLLWLFPADKAWARYIRRAVAIFLIAGASILVKDFINLMPEIWLPILAGIGAMLDKMLRDYMEKK